MPKSSHKSGSIEKKIQREEELRKRKIRSGLYHDPLKSSNLGKVEKVEQLPERYRSVDDLAYRFPPYTIVTIVLILILFGLFMLF